MPLQIPDKVFDSDGRAGALRGMAAIDTNLPHRNENVTCLCGRPSLTRTSTRSTICANERRGQDIENSGMSSCDRGSAGGKEARMISDVRSSSVALSFQRLRHESC